VSALQRVKNPILVARKVMEETDHVMLAGEGALRFARVMGFDDHDPVTPARRKDWQEKRDSIGNAPSKRSLKNREFLEKHPEYSGGTVGAAALDAQGVLAAATSTGGVTLKMVGRVGDTPIPARATMPRPMSPPRPRAPANS
jgi:beta-aspartyl-peptidase (threonine type)